MFSKRYKGCPTTPWQGLIEFYVVVVKCRGIVRSMNSKVKEHEKHCWLLQVDKSLVARHMAKTWHRMDFQHAQLSMTTQYHTQIYREVIEIQTMIAV